MAPAPSPPVDTALRTARILHAALVGSLLVYAVVVHVIRGANALRPTLAEPTLGLVRVAFYALAAGVVVVVLVLRSRWLTAEAAAALGRGKERPVALRLLQTRMIVCLALAETIGVYGLVLFVLGGSLRDFYVFLVPAFALQLLLVPTREVWEAAATGRG